MTTNKATTCHLFPINNRDLIIIDIFWQHYLSLLYQNKYISSSLFFTALYRAIILLALVSCSKISNVNQSPALNANLFLPSSLLLLKALLGFLKLLLIKLGF